MNNTERLLGKVDKYLSLVRYKYSTQEKLSRMTILRDYYKTHSVKPTEEKLITKIEHSESLANRFVLPLKVRGLFLEEGRPAVKYYTADELRKSVQNPINQKFPIKLDHRNKEVSVIVGGVDRISFNEKLKAVMWFGHINNETFARNILDNLITDVSVTVDSDGIPSDEFGIVGKNLIYAELSLVGDGAVGGNYIESY